MNKGNELSESSMKHDKLMTKHTQYKHYETDHHATL